MSSITGSASQDEARDIRWQFAGCEFDSSTLQLTVRDQRVALEPKPLNVLRYLLRHPDRVVTKEELLNAVWSEPVRGEHVVTKCIAKLRQALSDPSQQVIATVHGIGYRLIAPVVVQAGKDLIAALAVGAAVPGRPLWVLKQRLGEDSKEHIWLVAHSKTKEQRVFKFAQGSVQLAALKQEIDAYQQLNGKRLVRLLDWNLEKPPYFIESEYLPQAPLNKGAA